MICINRQPWETTVTEIETFVNQFGDPNNTNVFVPGLSYYTTEDGLRSFFQGFGEITYVKITHGNPAPSDTVCIETLFNFPRTQR